ncbi:hypothetical protein [Oceanobacillus damuensis]|uniref:hypothetical protein n=1 Tax=Oceanobacillus damuensis TaxID=937928 RepID=UPI00082C6459|nr:hypothetical protein [Oceanobacillus damuensis]
MNRYFKLVNFEFNRFLKIYLVLIGITIISQIIGVIVKSNQYLNMANDQIQGGSMSSSEFINQYGPISLYEIIQTLWFLGPIALCIVSLIIYVFFIWYRDWLGKNTFVYRLFMLPTARINIYFAKATTVFLMVLGLIALQLLLLPVEAWILQWIVPFDFRIDMSIREITGIFHYFAILFPNTIVQFIIHYGIGFMAVFVVFTAILFERSYRWKGILFGIIYGVLALLLFFAPVLLQATILYEFFYPIELLVLQMITGLTVIAGSIWMSNYLLNKKIRIW